MHMFKKILSYKAALAYVIFIIIINTSYSYFPFVTILDTPFSSGDFMVGMIYIFRDFAQREIKHYVILAMLLGAWVSYAFADKTMAIASLCAFSAAETIDWGIFTFTGKPLSQRLFLSAVTSAPVDSFIFLYIYGPLNTAGMVILTASKIIGVLFVWRVWQKRYKRFSDVSDIKVKA